MRYSPNEFRIINAHTHIFPQKIAEKASLSIGAFYGMSMRFPGGADILLEDGGKFGVEKYLVCSTATTPAQVRSINDFIHAECLTHGEFLGFATLHPAMDGIEDEIQRAVSLKLLGIKLHPDFQKFDIDDPAAVSLYRLAAKYGLPILFHMGDGRYEFSAPEKLLKIAGMLPDLRCIGAHFGGYMRWDDSLKYLKRENIFFDTSSSLKFLKKADVLRLIDHFGDDKIFFGTDFPMWGHEDEFERIFALDLSKNQYEKIFYENFAKFIGPGYFPCTINA